MAERIRTAPGTGTASISNMIFRIADENLCVYANSTWHYYSRFVRETQTFSCGNLASLSTYTANVASKSGYTLVATIPTLGGTGSGIYGHVKHSAIHTIVVTNLMTSTASNWVLLVYCLWMKT